MRQLVVAGRNLLLDQVVLAAVREDHVHLLGGRAADVGAEHDAADARACVRAGAALARAPSAYLYLLSPLNSFWSRGAGRILM